MDLTPKSESDGQTASQSNWREQVDCRGRSTGRIGPAPTLSLTVARLDRSELSMGGPVRGRYSGDKHRNGACHSSHRSGLRVRRWFRRTGRMQCRLHLGFQLLTRKAGSTRSPGLCCAARPAGRGLSNRSRPRESLTIRFPGWFGGRRWPHCAGHAGCATLCEPDTERQRVSRLERGDVLARERSVSWEKLASSRARDAGKFDVLRVAPFRITAYRYQQSLSNFLRLLTCKGLRTSFRPVPTWLISIKERFSADGRSDESFPLVRKCPKSARVLDSPAQAPLTNFSVADLRRRRSVRVVRCRV